MSPLDLIPPWVKLAAAAAAVAALLGAYQYRLYVERETVRKEMKERQLVIDSKRTDEALAESISNAKRTKLTLDRQQENQLAQDKQLAAARADAERNAADADRLRVQSASAARQWGATLSNAPTLSECQAGGDAIGVFADVLSRADRRAGLLAKVADTAYTRGLKCQADYGAIEQR